ncbi:VOC family protein [Nocardia sp. NPDC004068]|uniref:VOC family protein n=1 Tax=Nocardia sp. NPDC004068 TaxID=3364303 RepID=UPI003687E961
MGTRLGRVGFEVGWARGVAGFWAELLGWVVVVERGGVVEVVAPDAEGFEVGLWFGEGVGVKVGKNRIHLDLASRSVEHQRGLVDRALGLGARRVDIGQGEVPWEVMADPEGNEFCVLEPREQYVDTGAVAAIVVDARDPGRSARFWSAVSGWPVMHDSGEFSGIRSATGQGPWVEFLRSAGGERGRVRLDVLCSGAEDVDRLCAAGAKPLGHSAFGDAAMALADPDAYEFGLLRARSD